MAKNDSTKMVSSSIMVELRFGPYQISTAAVHGTQRNICQLLLDVLAENALFSNVGLKIDGE